MLRALVLAAIVLIPREATAQDAGRLHLKVVLTDAAGTPTPVPRHAVLISDNPPSAAPRRVVTAPDGTAVLNLRPGSYTVESDRPVAFQGRTYEWIQIVNIVAGRDVVLELTGDNALPPRPGAMPSPATTEVAPAADPAALLMQWQNSVVTLWTPTSRGVGFVIDPRGLVATNQRVIGQATSVEVQLTSAVKVAGRVLIADAARDVAILQVAPAALALVRPVPLPCALPAGPPLVAGDEVLTVTISAPGQNGIEFGAVRRVTSQTILADFGPARGGTGGPVFTEDGRVVGLTSVVDDGNRSSRGDFRIVEVAEACGAVRSAEKTMQEGGPPDGTHLPVEPVRPFPVEVLSTAVARRAGSLGPYAMSSSDFDITFITPVLAYAAVQAPNGPTMDFSNWSDYVRNVPPVLFVRVTPKQVESFWMTMVRGAAWTQGASLPPIKHFRSGFSRLRAFCGETEVVPIHPFTLEQRISETDAVREGFFVFAPDALGPHCGTVRLVLFSEKEPDKADARTVDPKLLRQIWQDFEPFRAVN